MVFFFLRHGIAADRDDPKYRNDSLRPLTAQGHEKMRRVASGMQVLNLKFDAIYSSPYIRARQTAEIVAKSYGLKNKSIHLTENLLPPATIEVLLKEIRTLLPESKNVLLVGHEPHLTEMISSLLKSPRALPIDFKKGGLCSVSIDPSAGQRQAILNWLLTPTQLGLLYAEPKAETKERQ